MDPSAIDVLFIAAFGRSGSTLLDRILGRIDGFVSVGEIRQLWRRGLMEGQLCGCGEPVPECPFWREVLADAFGPFTPDTARHNSVLAGELDRVRFFQAACWPEMHYPSSKRVEYTEVLGKLYRSVKRVSGAGVILDSSKSVTHGLLLRRAPGVRLHTVHLVRDSRAVAFSWMRRRARPEIHWEETRMPIYGALRTSLDWMLVNTLICIAKKQFARSMSGRPVPLVRYEDLAADAQRTVSGMLEAVGVGLPQGAEVPGHSFTAGVDHTVSGNPVRFQSGTIEIRPDLEWRTALPAGKRLLVTTLTWPLLRRYGYFRRDTGGE